MKQLCTVGGYGSTVAVFKANGRLVLRWRDPVTRKRRTRKAAARVLTKARVEALELAAQLEARRGGVQASRPETTTWRGLFAWYRTHVRPTMSPAQQRRDDQAERTWSTVLPLDTPVDHLDPLVLERFKLDRKVGRLPIAPRPVSDRTVGADLEWLRRVCNHGLNSPAVAVERNPVLKVAIPDTPRPKQPVATWDRYERLRAVADRVGSQRLFGGLLDLVVALGWRVTALCSLHVEDLDLRPREHAPRGRIRKRAEFDKEGVEQWVPVSDWLAPRLQALLDARTTLKAPGPWLFPQVQNPRRPWTKDYASARLEAAERLAGLDPLDGGNWHPFRRMWATHRKGLPMVDVAHAGGWKTIEMVRRYQQIDEATVHRVMNAGLPTQSGE